MAISSSSVLGSSYILYGYKQQKDAGQSFDNTHRQSKRNYSVERQAQHRPDRLKKPRTGSVGTDWLGRVHKPVHRPVRRKAGSVQRTGRPLCKIFRREYILGVSVELFNEH